jgi:hypothetical protein
MNWKFWQKEKHRETSSGFGEVKLPKPRELPQRVGMYLVTKLSLDPDWVWNLKCVLRPLADQKNDFDIRIFNPETAAAKGVTVANFNSLDPHPHMILFSGTFNRKTGNVQLEEKLERVA